MPCVLPLFAAWSRLPFSPLLCACGLRLLSNASEMAANLAIIGQKEFGRSIIWDYGRTSHYPKHAAQTGQSQLGASHAARPSARNRIRTTSQNVAAHAGNVCFLRRVRQWCWQNRNRCYIPEWLLEKWRIAVDPYTSDAA